MKKSVLEQADKPVKSYQSGKGWQRALAGFAAAVTIFSSFGPILPVAAEQKWYCGYEEHQHVAECSEKRKICGFEDEQAQAHAHTEQCYRKLICTLEEGAHVHTEDCVSTEEVLICENTDPEHVHDETCSEIRESYICGLSEDGHTHGEGCYEIAEEPQCGLTGGHVHGDECWETVVICRKEEHVHTLQCESNPDADVEDDQIWAENAEKRMLTGVWRTDLVKVARGEVGYAESTENFFAEDNGSATRGYTRYGDWYGDPYGDWCAMFVSFCLYYADIPESSIPYGANVGEWVSVLRENEMFSETAEGCKQGDLLFFDTDEDGAPDRVGILLDVTSNGCQTIEGDREGRVEIVTHETGEDVILGFAVLPEKPEEEEEPETTAATNASTETTAATTETTEATTETTGATTETTEATTEATTETTEATTETTEATTETTGDGKEKPMLMTAANGLEENGIMALAEAGPIEVGTQLNVEIQGPIVRIPFTPEVTHPFVFRSYSTGDTYGYLYDADGNTITSNDDSDGRNFVINYTLTGGTLYYLGVRFYSNSSGTIPVLLSYSGCEYSKNEAGELVCKYGETVPKSGTCGEGVEWTYENGVLTIHGNGAMTDFSAAATVPWSPYRKEIQTVVVDDGVTKVGSNAFSALTNATQATLPESVTSIGASAFSGCSKLASMNIPSGVTKIESSTFSGCSGLTSITIPTNVTSIGSSAFSGCSGLTGITIPEGVTTIESSTFSGCSGLTGITIPNSVTSIGSSAFQNCTGLTNIVLPTDVTSIGSSAFSGSGLTSFVIPANVTSIQSGTFSGCSGLTGITIPNSVTSIGSSAFSKSGLTRIEIPNSVTQIENSTFSGCKNLESVTLPDTTTRIGDSAFYNCSGLTEFRVPPKTTNIGSNAFALCSQLETLYWDAEKPVSFSSSNPTGSQFKTVVGTSVDKFTDGNLQTLLNMRCSGLEFKGENYISLSALSGRSMTAPLTTLPDARYYVDAQGVLYRIGEDGKAYLAYCPPEVTDSYTVPGTIPAEDGGAALPVAGVDSYAFNQATVSSLTFAAPENIKQFSDFAFYHAVNLESINGKTTKEDILGLFTLDYQGTQPFQHTKITTDEKTTTGVIQVAEDGLEMIIETGLSKEHQPNTDGTSFLYYTGETAQTDITISNPDSSEVGDSETKVRIYYRFDTGKATLNYRPQETPYTLKTTNNSYKMWVSETGIPNCYCLEIERPRQGDTIGLSLKSTYPSPTSGGGSASIWGGILTKEEQDALGGNLLPITDNHSLRWDTKKDVFPLQKALNSTPSMLGDGKGGSTIQNLTYRISIPRDGDTLEGIGKDYMTDVEYRDVLTLGDGVTISDKVKQAIRQNTYTVYYNSGTHYFRMPDGTNILTLRPNNSSFAGSSYMKDMHLAINAEGKLEIRWRFCNTNLGTEIDAASFYLSIQNGTLEVKNPQPDTTYHVTNDVYNTEHFMYSGDVEQDAKAEAEFKTTVGRLEFDKRILSGSRMGETSTFQITAKNPAVTSYNNLASIEDQMDENFYLTAQQMVTLFDDPDTTSIKITGATLCDPAAAGQPVTGMNGTGTGTTSLPNTGNNTVYHGMEYQDGAGCTQKTGVTITLTRAADGQIQIEFVDKDNNPIATETCDGTATAIQAILDAQGFLVTYNAKYRIAWTHSQKDDQGNLIKDGQGNPIPIPIVGGGTVTKTFTGSNKDTFMMLTGDREHQYSNSGHWSYNRAYAYNSSHGQIAYDSYDRYYNIDFYLNKGYSKDGQAIDEDTELNEGDVLDYSLTAQHTGSGHYDLLPLVDHMVGGQALLVPADLNTHLDGVATKVTVKDVDYYRLDKVGSYSHVWTTPDHMADSVTVTQNETGLDTIIKWYFTNYGGSRTDTVTYQSMVCPSVAAPNQPSYLLSNEVWLGDHQTHRLYATLPGKYAMTFDFDKKIVDRVHDDDAEGYTYCPVAKGQTVVYRLMLEGKIVENDKIQELTLTGKEMYDALPPSIDGYWQKDVNVTLQYGSGCNVTNGDHWTVEGPEANNKNQQYIRWADDFTIKFAGPAYIYVTLTFPDDTEGDPKWQNYAHKYNASTLVNTFHVRENYRSVTHDLAIEGEVRLQKGVYSSHYQYVSNMNGQKNAKHYYSNRGYNNYIVTYYVTLYNGGESRLYLTDMQDRLPKGFTLASSGGNYSGSSGANVYKDQDGKTQANYRRFHMTPSVIKTENGTQWIKFHFSQYTSSGYSNYIRYDDTRSMYYLNPGEAITFTYDCYTNNAADTEDVALNVVTMPYYDYTNSRVRVDNDSKTVAYNSNYDPNDGGCDLRDTKWASDNGFTGAERDWLSSDVTVTRGGIRPGITKKLTSRTDIYGGVNTNVTSAEPSDTLNWTVTAENDGDSRLVDYTLTDEMQRPYGFTGDVKYTTSVSNGSSYTSQFSTRTLFTVQRIPDDNTKVKIRYQGHLNSSSSSTMPFISDLTIGGDPLEMRIYDGYTGGSLIYLSIDKNDKGNYVMSIRLTGDRLSMPAGGRGVLTLSTVNYEDTAENKQFLNQCYITPMIQQWPEETNKGNITDLKTDLMNGSMQTVRNSAPVTTAYGYMTESLKRIWELDDPSNAAASDTDPNYIVLENKGKLFRYRASIRNDTPKAMTQLILIDGLPEIGDHSCFLNDDPRFSQFQVSLADEPNFTVTVVPSDNADAGVELDPIQYTLEFSRKTSFDDSDWRGESTWGSSFAGARSIRLKINDPTGTLIPANHIVSLEFNGIIDEKDDSKEEEAEPGEIAWNSFGYHYQLYGSPASLEAAPLKVGIKVPTIPWLQKKLVDHQGAQIVAAKDESFSFRVYEGQALTGSYDTAEALAQALTDAGRKYTDFTLTVPEGKSVSEVIRMWGDEDWNWVDEAKYTIVELPTSEEYAFHAFTGATSTFTYDSDKELTIVGENTSLRWSVALTKTDPEGEALKGAVFGLYSPSQTDFEIPADYEQFNAAAEVEYDGKTWYLAGIGTTDREGKLSWDDLLEESYYLLEIQAPDGYVKAKDGLLLESRHESQGVYAVTVENPVDYELPESGGPGTWAFTAAGLILTAAAGLLLLRKKRGLWA